MVAVRFSGEKLQGAFQQLGRSSSGGSSSSRTGASFFDNKEEEEEVEADDYPTHHRIEPTTSSLGSEFKVVALQLKAAEVEEGELGSCCCSFFVLLQDGLQCPYL